MIAAVGCGDDDSDPGGSAGAASDGSPAPVTTLSPESTGTGGPTSSPEPTQTDGASPSSESSDDESAAASATTDMTIEIGAIDVSAGVMGVGLADDGAMETPPYDSNLAGWYTEGPEPGDPGPSVVVAHVDHPGGGPDTFARLDELDPGDEIVVSETGEEHTFVVTDTEQVDKDGLPYDRIWPQTSDELLTLITCDGQYLDGEYEDNLIVYAEAA